MRLHTSSALTRPKLSICGKPLCRQFTTTVTFPDGEQTVYISMAKLDAIMQMLSPGQHVTVDNANGCKWTLACHNVNVFSLSCTKNAEQGVRCLVHGGGMSVVCKELHPNNDDRPFIVLTETKPSKRHIPVWARYSPLTMYQYERNQPDYRVSCPPSRMCSSARGQRGYYEVPVPEGACTQSSSRGGVQRKPTVAVLHRGAIVIEHAASLPVVSHATGDTAGDLVEVVAGEATVVVPSTFGVRIRQ